MTLASYDTLIKLKRLHAKQGVDIRALELRHREARTVIGAWRMVIYKRGPAWEDYELTDDWLGPYYEAPTDDDYRSPGPGKTNEKLIRKLCPAGPVNPREKKTSRDPHDWDVTSPGSAVPPPTADTIAALPPSPEESPPQYRILARQLTGYPLPLPNEFLAHYLFKYLGTARDRTCKILEGTNIVRGLADVIQEYDRENRASITWLLQNTPIQWTHSADIRNAIKMYLRGTPDPNGLHDLPMYLNYERRGFSPTLHTRTTFGGSGSPDLYSPRDSLDAHYATRPVPPELPLLEDPEVSEMTYITIPSTEGPFNARDFLPDALDKDVVRELRRSIHQHKIMEYDEEGAWLSGEDFEPTGWNIEKVLRLQLILEHPSLFPYNAAFEGSCGICGMLQCGQRVYHHRTPLSEKVAPALAPTFEKAYACALEGINCRALHEMFADSDPLYHKIWAQHRLFGEMVIRTRQTRPGGLRDAASQLGYPDFLSVTIVLGLQARREWQPTGVTWGRHYGAPPLQRDVEVTATFGSVLTPDERHKLSMDRDGNTSAYQDVTAKIRAEIVEDRFTLPTVEQVMFFMTPPASRIHQLAAPRSEPGQERQIPLRNNYDQLLEEHRHANFLGTTTR